MKITANRRQVLGGIGAAAAAAALPGSMAFGQPVSLRIGTSSVGSVFYTLAVGAGELIRDKAGINTTVEPVGGSAANVNGIGRETVDLAVTNSFASFSGYNAMHGFNDPIDHRLIIQGQPSYRWIFTRPGAGIESARDLEGRTIIGERRALPELRLVLDALATALDLDIDSMNIVATADTGEAFAAIRAGSVDAFVMPFSPRAGIIEEGMRDRHIQFLHVTPEERDAMLEHLPAAFFPVDQRANDFSNQEEVVPLVSLNTYMIGRTDLDNETVYQVVKTLFEENETFISYHAAARNWTVENTLIPPAVPLHDGVVQYFREIGVWTDEHEAVQQRLLSN
ncbi:TAXI family TRAP transporter solute-binding subunit [Alkalilacustris brevis]|uniref:TAXI family TRAP transporter solute-binding subunit n=1 Tax=Alkalilacustris brevis TaxID=2026338 RepID=UPI000E0D56C7|nr:TAXI family TRAP transporter solute-binding subunit [Alkalilacustris brevis]